MFVTSLECFQIRDYISNKDLNLLLLIDLILLKIICTAASTHPLSDLMQHQRFLKIMMRSLFLQHLGKSPLRPDVGHQKFENICRKLQILDD